MPLSLPNCSCVCFSLVCCFVCCSCYYFIVVEQQWIMTIAQSTLDAFPLKCLVPLGDVLHGWRFEVRLHLWGALYLSLFSPIVCFILSIDNRFLLPFLWFYSKCRCCCFPIITIACDFFVVVVCVMQLSHFDCLFLIICLLLHYTTCLKTDY